MKKSLCGTVSTMLIVLLFVCTYQAKADISREAKKKNKGLRVPSDCWDHQFNSVSNISFPVTNYGMNFLDAPEGRGGFYWPRGSDNQYIFAAGLWFGAMKYHTETVESGDSNYYKKYVAIGCNPNTGKSWFIPGRIEDSEELDRNNLKDYRVYFSTDMKSNGEPLNEEDGPNWPIWQAGDYSENYIFNVDDRNFSAYPNGPTYKSDEDIFCTYKDTDLNYYEGGVGLRSSEGYPLGLQFEQTIYSWGEGPMEDAIIICYKAINMSSDTLFDCWLAPMFDPDIAKATHASSGAGNDRADFYDEEDSLSLVYAWTGTDRGEAGQGFGYLGFSMISSPAVDEYGFVRHDESKYNSDEQLGLGTCRIWPIEYDPGDDDEVKYFFVSAMVLDGDTGPADKRLLLSSGPFNMLPGDTVETAISINLARPAVNDDPNGAIEDLAGLVESVKTARKTFFNELLPNIVEKNYPEKNELLIYPNPADEKINVTFSSATASKILVEITDIFGNSYYTGTEYMDAANNNFSIDTKDLQSGVYYITINDGENSVTRLLNIVK